MSHELDIINNFFKKISIVNVLFGKKSDLTKDTEDFLRLTARSNKTNISLDINYYSRNEIRVILIDSKNFSIYVDLKRNIFRLNRDKKSFELRKKYTQDFTFLKTHEAIINGKDKSSLSKLNDGLKVLKMIQNIKKI